MDMKVLKNYFTKRQMKRWLHGFKIYF